ncbi:MAG TPA: lysozyme inhibitor LprI family protein [Drouetiella sp.]
MNFKSVVVSALVSLSFCGQAFAQSQVEMNEKASKELEATKRDATKAARAVATKYSSVKNFKNKMDEVQELYANFVQGHLKTIFPVPKGADVYRLYGTVNPLCECQIEAGLWQKRIKELNDWSKAAPKKDLTALKADYAAADKKLNDVYVKVRKSPAKSGETGAQFTKELVDAEVEWIAFRNSDCELSAMSGGSESSKYEKMIALTKERTNQLNDWIKGMQEGDTCCGSRPVF